MSKLLLLILIFLSSVFNLAAQIVINEASNRNYKQIIDEEEETNDWIELYNAGSVDVNLEGWALSDSKNNLGKWKFGSIDLAANDFLLVHASGKDRFQVNEVTNWESAVLPVDSFQYLIPDRNTPQNWYETDFNDDSWGTGKSGFGYGDNDDQTNVPQKTLAIYLRRKFTIQDTSAIVSGFLHVDYDDGFIAYLNGFEIARANVAGTPAWNSTASENHEAKMYLDATPEKFEIDFQYLKNILVQGENVLSVEVHNVSEGSTDLSIIPILSFAIKVGNSLFRSTPAWLDQPVSEIIHANFKISQKGEKIFLSDTVSLIDSLNVKNMLVNHSIGRVTDGAETIGYFTSATPGASNNTSVANTQGYTLKPDFNIVAGFYNSAIDLVISSIEEGITIRYTQDGSEPTETSSVFNGSLKISSTKCIKARSFSANKLPGEVSTATFFINESFELPVLSVSTNNSNLYGNEGVFTNWGESWNIPSYIEYFEKNKELAFEQWAGMQVDGGAGGSRSLEQHSFRIEPGNGTLGDGDLKYSLMHRRPNRSNFPSFYVRNGSNQHLTLPYKDGLEVTALGRNTYTYYSAYQPMVVFLNGDYFGVYELREKINDDYLVDNYEMDIDSLDFLGVSYFKGQQLEALRGSIDPFVADFNRFVQMDNQSSTYLDEVEQFLDLKSYTDYIIAESWVGNNDWPFNNIKLFRCKSTKMRWQWAINDLEWALNPNGWTSSSFDHIQFMLDKNTGNYYTGFWFNLMKNYEYKAFFVNRFADLMNTSYHFSEIGPLEQEMYEEIFPEMDGEYERWGTSNITSQMNKFTSNHETFRSELERRSAFVRSDLQQHFDLDDQIDIILEVEPEGAGSIQISTVSPSNYPWEGIYFSDVEIQITALPNLGYKFSRWDENSFINDVSQSIISGEFNEDQLTFKAHFEASEFDSDGIVISEINYKQGNNYESSDWIELCNLSLNEVNLNGWYFTDDDSAHVFAFNEDLYLSAKQRLVVANNVDRFKALNPEVDVFSSEFNFGFGTPSDEINLYNSDHEKVISFQYSDQYPWALGDDYSGRTLELRSPQADLNNPTSWFKGCIGGSPGMAYQACEEIQVLTRKLEANRLDLNVYPNPASDYIDVEMYLDEELAYCTLKIYNMMGLELKKLSLNQMNKGWHHHRIALTDINANILILKLNTDRYEKIVKIVKK